MTSDTRNVSRKLGAEMGALSAEDQATAQTQHAADAVVDAIENFAKTEQGASLATRQSVAQVTGRARSGAVGWRFRTVQGLCRCFNA